MTTRHYVKSQNTIISFEGIDFWPRIFLILYPSIENSTTHITIIDAHSAHLAPTPLKWRSEKDRDWHTLHNYHEYTLIWHHFQFERGDPKISPIKKNMNPWPVFFMKLTTTVFPQLVSPLNNVPLWIVSLFKKNKLIT